jgi:hypothetical protein
MHHRHHNHAHHIDHVSHDEMQAIRTKLALQKAKSMARAITRRTRMARATSQSRVSEEKSTAGHAASRKLQGWGLLRMGRVAGRSLARATTRVRSSRISRATTHTRTDLGMEEKSTLGEGDGFKAAQANRETAGEPGLQTV